MNVDDLTLVDDLYIATLCGQALSDLLIEIAMAMGDDKMRFSALLDAVTEMRDENVRLKAEVSRLGAELLESLSGTR